MHRFHPDRFSVHTLPHASHPTSFAAFGTTFLVPFDTVTPRAPYVPVLQQILPTALRIGPCVGKHRLLYKRNVWPHTLYNQVAVQEECVTTMVNRSLADSPDMYPLLLEAPCVKRARSSKLHSCVHIVQTCLEAKWKTASKLVPKMDFLNCPVQIQNKLYCCCTASYSNTQAPRPCRYRSLQAIFGTCVRRVAPEPAKGLHKSIRDVIKRTCKSCT